MIDEQSSASGHDYASDRSAIGAGRVRPGEEDRLRVGPGEVVCAKEPKENQHSMHSDTFLSSLLYMDISVTDRNPELGDNHLLFLTDSKGLLGARNHQAFDKPVGHHW